MKIHYYFLIILFFVANSLVLAQNKFPKWMDDVKFEKKSSFSEFDGPKDPETGKITTLESKRGKGFKPKLPDFSELRKKATKTSKETGSDTVSIQENKSSSSIQSLKDVPELATATNIIEAVNRLASETTASITNNIAEDEEPSDEELIRQRIYRPGRIKSFYIESKEAEKRKANEIE